MHWHWSDPCKSGHISHTSRERLHLVPKCLSSRLRNNIANHRRPPSGGFATGKEEPNAFDCLSHATYSHSRHSSMQTRQHIATHGHQATYMYDPSLAAIEQSGAAPAPAHAIALSISGGRYPYRLLTLTLAAGPERRDAPIASHAGRPFLQSGLWPASAFPGCLPGGGPGSITGRRDMSAAPACILLLFVYLPAFAVCWSLPAVSLAS